MIGIAVGSQKWTMVQAGQKEGVEFPVGQASVTTIANASEDRRVLIAGNRRWAAALAYTLKASGVEACYLGGPERKAGQKINNAKILAAALEKNFSGEPFFREIAKPEDRARHPWVELASAYMVANDDIRRSKHRTLDALRVLFPELPSLEEKLWGKKSRTALESRNWNFFGDFGPEYNYSDSIAKHIPAEKREEADEALRGALTALDEAEKKKSDLKERVIREVGDTRVAELYNRSFSAMLVVLLVGWNQWGSNKKGWRRLRAYAGFSVTRLDSKGKMRINRRRPEIRVALYFLQKSGRGKDVIADAMTRMPASKEGKMKRVERLEHILKDIWKILNGKEAMTPVTQ